MAKPPICSVAACGKPNYSNKLCVAHFRRWQRWGDPLLGHTSPGAKLLWLETVAAEYDGDECLIFPFKRGDEGYGTVFVDSKSVKAHAFLLNLTSPKPSPKHECCHSCGKGQDGCVTRRHLYWGARKENVADAIRHGTFKFIRQKTGERNPACRVSDDVVREIRAALAAGEMQKTIVERFNVSQAQVSRIKNKKSRSSA